MKYEKDSPEFRMFKEYYSIIQSFDDPETDDDIAKMDEAFKVWVKSLPQSVQVFGIFLSAAFVNRWKMEIQIKRGTSRVVINPDGSIAIKGEKR